MLKILQDFEEAAARFAPLVLIVPGLAAVIVGLFVWLGGLGFRRLMVALLGATAGGWCGFFLIGRNLGATVVSAGVAALIAIIFEKVFIVVLAVALAAIFGFAVLARPYLGSSGAAVPPGQAVTPEQGGDVTVRQSMETIKAHAVSLAQTVKRVCSEMPIYSWAIIAGLIVLFAIAGVYLRRLVSALCCAALGTTLIFGGLILLLLFKGSSPISRIGSNTPFYAAVFAAMAAFGTVEQLLLCRGDKKGSAKQKGKDKDQKDSGRPGRRWRGR